MLSKVFKLCMSMLRKQLLAVDALKKQFFNRVPSLETVAIYFTNQGSCIHLAALEATKAV
jgi:hypothetical protein